MTSRSALLVMTVILCMFAASPVLSAQEYLITDITALVGRPINPRAMNNSGMIVGSYVTENDETHAFSYAAGSFTDLGTLGGRFSVALAVNDAEEIVGWSQAEDGESHAFLFTGGALTDLHPGTGMAIAQGINNAGQIAGQAVLEDGRRSAVIYHDGALHDIGAMTDDSMIGTMAFDVNSSGQTVVTVEYYDNYHRSFLFDGNRVIELLPDSHRNCHAQGINDTGQIVGAMDVALEGSGWHAFLYESGIIQELGTLGGRLSFANDVNNSGQVVGTAQLAEGRQQAFIFERGAMRDLNELVPRAIGWELDRAIRINDRGEILGQGAFNGSYRVFLLTPTEQ